jgi:hypothetical protein
MFHPARLEPFDLLLWVGNGHQAGLISDHSQPTISRAAHHVTKSLGLNLRKIRGEWLVGGDTSVLASERSAQQAARFAARTNLRLEAGAISPRLLADPPPEGWILGRADAINQPRSLSLLKQRVIDAWVCASSVDLPPQSLQALTVLELYRTPLRLVASPAHPLADTSRLRADDLASFPSVALEDNWYPTSAAHLRTHGLWRDPRRLSHHRSQHWEGRTADDLTLAYASPLTVARQSTLCDLDFDLGLEQALGLVVLREHANHPSIQELHGLLQRRVAAPSRKKAKAACAA